MKQKLYYIVDVEGRWIDGPLREDQLDTVDFSSGQLFIESEDVEVGLPDRVAVFVGRGYFYRDVGLDEALDMAVTRWIRDGGADRVTVKMNESEAVELPATLHGVRITRLLGVVAPMSIIVGQFEQFDTGN